MGVRSLVSYLFVTTTCCTINVSAAFSSELSGFSFNEPVQGRHIFSVFRHREQPEGWGLAFYPDESLQLFREPKKALECDLAEFLITYDYLEAPLLVAQVKSSRGTQIHETTQPFQRELNGKRYAFIHCGSLSDFQQHLKLERFKPMGESDSEHLFCFILGQIEKEGIQTWDNAKFYWLQSEILREANGLGTLNCLLSDGDYLFAYHDKKSGENFLHYKERKAPYGTVHFVDTNEDIDLSNVYPSSASGYILCTKPLTIEQWTSVGHGQLIVLKDGVIVWEGTTPIDNGSNGVIQTYSKCTLIQNYPNPFKSTTTIKFTLPKEAFVALEICNVKGKVLKVLENGVLKSGYHTVSFNGMDNTKQPLSNGVYILRLKTDEYIETREIIISK